MVFFEQLGCGEALFYLNRNSLFSMKFGPDDHSSPHRKAINLVRRVPETYSKMWWSWWPLESWEIGNSTPTFLKADFFSLPLLQLNLSKRSAKFGASKIFQPTKKSPLAVRNSEFCRVFNDSFTNLQFCSSCIEVTFFSQPKEVTITWPMGQPKHPRCHCLFLPANLPSSFFHAAVFMARPWSRAKCSTEMSQTHMGDGSGPRSC